MADEYKFFKKELDKDTYFSKWEDDKLMGLTEDLKEKIYDRYLVKCEVFNRDNFTCTNLNCTTKHSPITLHHVKWQKNGGVDSVHNCVTLCDACHKGFHAASMELHFSKNKKLPKKIRGQVFKLSKSDQVNWKEVKKKMRRFRKTIIPTLQDMDDEELYAMLKIVFDTMFSHK